MFCVSDACELWIDFWLMFYSPECSQCPMNTEYQYKQLHSFVSNAFWWNIFALSLCMNGFNRWWLVNGVSDSGFHYFNSTKGKSIFPHLFSLFFLKKTMAIRWNYISIFRHIKDDSTDGWMAEMIYVHMCCRCDAVVPSHQWCKHHHWFHFF